MVTGPSTANGKYVFERRLGGGGMAEVFVGRTVGAAGFSRPVAIKRILDGFAADRRFVEMLEEEARLSSNLHHPNLVSVLDFDRDSDGRLFLVMELVEGTDLSELLATGALPIPLVIHLVVEILRGLDYAHDLPLRAGGTRGLVHRDISPNNVLLSWEGAVKVSDFGIAKAREATQATASTMIKGKLRYMSPEQGNGLPLDGRSDLFSVGVMLFEMLCLQPLFAGQTNEETFRRLYSDPIPNVRDVRPDVPKDLARVVASFLERDRDQRVSSAAVALAALVACDDYPRDGREDLIATMCQRFAGRAPVRARHVSHVSHVDATQLPQTPAPALRAWRTGTTPATLQPSPKTNRRWVWTAAVSFVAVVAIIATITAMRSRQSTSTAEPVAGSATLAPAAKPSSAAQPTAAATPPAASIPAPATSAPASRLTAPGSGTEPLHAATDAGSGSGSPMPAAPPAAPDRTQPAKGPAHRSSNAGKGSAGGIHVIPL